MPFPESFAKVDFGSRCLFRPSIFFGSDWIVKGSIKGDYPGSSPHIAKPGCTAAMAKIQHFSDLTGVAISSKKKPPCQQPKLLA